MPTHTIKAQPLTQSAFSLFGDVIEVAGADHHHINAGSIQRFHQLATVELGEDPAARAIISIAKSNSSASLPHRLTVMERHPLGSQAFIPLNETRTVIAVAPAGDNIPIENIKAFVTNGRQGFNYHRGVWHMPLISLQQGQELLIVDRQGPGNNCEERYFTKAEIVVEL